MLGEISPRQRGTYQSGGLFLIQKIVVSVAANSFTFSNIPQNFNDLKVITYTRFSDAGATPGCGLRFNNDSGSNYYFQLSQAVGSSTGFSSSNNNYAQFYNSSGAGAVAGAFSVGEALIPQYATANGNVRIYKSEGGFSAASGTCQQYVTGSWTGTSPINAVTVLDFSGGNINVGSYLYLYGIY